MSNIISGNVVVSVRRVYELDCFRSVWVAIRANGLQIRFMFTERHAYIYGMGDFWNPEIEAEIIAVMKRQFPNNVQIQKL